MIYFGLFVVGSELLIVIYFTVSNIACGISILFFGVIRMKANLVPGPFLTIFLCICLRFQEKTNFKTFCRMLNMILPQYWMSS